MHIFRHLAALVCLSLALTGCFTVYQEPPVGGNSATVSGFYVKGKEISRISTSIFEIDHHSLMLSLKLNHIYRVTPGIKTFVIQTTYAKPYFGNLFADEYTSFNSLSVDIKPNHHYRFVARVNADNTVAVWAEDNGRKVSNESVSNSHSKPTPHVQPKF